MILCFSIGTNQPWSARAYRPDHRGPERQVNGSSPPASAPAPRAALRSPDP
jgi:hypothetical protein